MPDLDVIEGVLKEAEGRVRSAIGELTGDNKQKLKGAAQQVEGSVQKRVGHVKDAVRDANAKEVDETTAVRM